MASCLHRARARRTAARALRWSGPETEEVRVEREDDLRLREVEVHARRRGRTRAARPCAGCRARAGPKRTTLACGSLAASALQQALGGRADLVFDEERRGPCPASPASFARRSLAKASQSSHVRGLAGLERRTRALGVVELEHFGLRPDVATRRATLGCFGLPSILVGRPSLASTRRPTAPSERCIAVAYMRTPGITFSGCLTNGRISSSGRRRAGSRSRPACRARSRRRRASARRGG